MLLSLWALALVLLAAIAIFVCMCHLRARIRRWCRTPQPAESGCKLRLSPDSVDRLAVGSNFLEKFLRIRQDS
jgi:hypothetical protein